MRTWINFFFQQNKSDKILIESVLDNNELKVVEISIDESLKNFGDGDYQDSDHEEDDEKEMMINLFSGSESSVSVIHLKTKASNEESFETQIVSSTKGLISKDLPELTIVQLMSKLEQFEKLITASFDKTEVGSLTNIRNYK